ncbi:MAG: hypothetical protein ACXWQR_20220 [Ktedonobacterales bacterium]
MASTEEVQSPRLRNQRAFWIVWSGQSASVLGNAFYGIAVIFWAATLHAGMSTIAGVLAGLGLTLSLPRLLLGPFVAGAVDRLDRKWLMAALDALRGGVITRPNLSRGLWLKPT